MRKAIMVAALVIVSACAVRAEETAFTISLERAKVAPGKKTQLFMAFANAENMPVPELPFVSGLDIKYQKSLRQPIPAGGVERPGIVHVYKVIALKAGSYRFGPLSFEHAGTTYRSNVVTLEVTKEALVEERAAPGAEKPDLSRRIYLTYEIPRPQVYVNELIPLRVKLSSDWLDLEDVSVPDLTSTELIVEPFTREKAKIVEQDGQKFAILEYRTSVMAPTPGTYTLGPATAHFAVSRRKPLPSGAMPDLLNDNESVYERAIGAGERLVMDLTTGPITVTVAPLPQQGRPDGFKGAIGSFDFTMKAHPARLKEGDALTLTLEVTGQGNYKTVTSLPVPALEGFRSYEPQVTRTDSGVVVRQTMRFIGPGAREVPKATFSFFDPAAGAYRSISQGPLPLELELSKKPVAAAGVAAAPAAGKKAAGEDLVAVKDRPGALRTFDPFFYISWPFAALGVVPFFALFCAVLVKRRMDFLAADVEYANWLRSSQHSSADLASIGRALRAGKTDAFYDTVFEVMRAYLGMRLLVPAGGITEKTVDDILGGRIEDPEIMAALRRIFFHCHLARFTSVELSKEDMKKTQKDVQAVISYLNDRTYLLKK